MLMSTFNLLSHHSETWNEKPPTLLMYGHTMASDYPFIITVYFYVHQYIYTCMLYLWLNKMKALITPYIVLWYQRLCNILIFMITLHIFLPSVNFTGRPYMIHRKNIQLYLSLQYPWFFMMNWVQIVKPAAVKMWRNLLYTLHINCEHTHTF